MTLAFVYIVNSVECEEWSVELKHVSSGYT